MSPKKTRRGSRGLYRKAEQSRPKEEAAVSAQERTDAGGKEVKSQQRRDANEGDEKKRTEDGEDCDVSRVERENEDHSHEVPVDS